MVGTKPILAPLKFTPQKSPSDDWTRIDLLTAIRLRESGGVVCAVREQGTESTAPTLLLYWPDA